jgi:hypothetical protein
MLPGMRAYVVALSLLASQQLLAQPLEWAEFMHGKRQTYNSRAEPKAGGIEVSFDFPTTWRSTAAKRPHTLAQVTSRDGRGLELCNLLLRVLPVPASYEPEKREIEDMFDADFLRGLAPPQAAYISGRRVRIDGQPGGAVRYAMQADQAGIAVASQWVSYVFYYDKRLLFFSCSVGDEGTVATSKLLARFDLYAPLFQQMASSIVIHSRWKKP